MSPVIWTTREGKALVVYREGRLTGWSLTREGRAESDRLLAEELEGAGCRAELDKAYRRFLDLNRGLLQVCTDWQLRDETTPNDHSDAAYDKEVIGRLADIHGAVTPITDDLAALLARYGGYGPRLTAALERLQAGEVDYFTKPILDSYHTVWFELHEDLLATLGLERSKEETHE